MLNPQENPWLYPELIQSAEGMHLFARQALTTYLAGVHGSRRVGAEQEFSQYRSYQPGDDLRHLDWKVYARSGRLYIKEAEIHTRLFIRFVLDASASMNHQDGRWSKFNYARAMIALLALIAKQQGDLFGLYAANEQLVHNRMPVNDKTYIHRFMYELSRLKASASWPDISKLSYFPDQPDANEMLVFFTDLYQEKDELFEAIRRLKKSKNEVLVLHLLSAHELDPQKWQKPVSLRDLETGEMMQLQSEGDRRRSAENMQEFIRQSKAFLLQQGIRYAQVNMDEQPHEAVSLFLKSRLLMR